MEPVVNRTTKKYNNKNQITKITNTNYDQNSMFTLKKRTTKSNSHKIKPKQNKISYTSLEKILDLSSMQLANRSTKRAKCAKFKNTFPFLKTNYFKEINIINY